MNPRYALRFDSGERQGETVPLNVAPGAAFTVGRKPGNSLQVVETSVSGHHAELTVDADGVQLRDLDSTNGTRVAGDRVRTAVLRHGDELAFGNVQFTLLDLASGAPAPPTALPSLKPAERPNLQRGALPAPAGEGLARTAVQPREEALEITAADLARSRRGSKAGLIALGALAAVGAGAWFWLRGQGGEERRSPERPVVSPSGNLVATGYSFEEGEGWSADEGAPSVFRTAASARASGRVGLAVELGGADLTEDEVPSADFALHRSDAARVRAGSLLEVQVSARTSGAARARLGLAFSGTGEQAPLAHEVWAEPIESSEGHELFAFACAVPPGCDRAAVLLAAEVPAGSAGTVHVDDASLVAAGTAPAVLQSGSFEVVGLGRPPRALALAKVDRVLVSNVHAGPAANAARSSRTALALAPEATDVGFSLRLDAPAVLRLRAEPTLAAGGLATLGNGGYLAHSAGFERNDVTDVLLGKDSDLVRLRFPAPVRVSSISNADGADLAIELAEAGTIRVQLRFEEDRVAAQGLARRAREAERAGRESEAFAGWGALLAEYPFEQTLVDEAATARGGIVQRGLTALRELTRELDRARSFRLIDLYDELDGRARALAGRFAGSEVEGRALELALTLGVERATLARDVDRYAIARLEALAAFLEQNQSPRLAREVREHLAELQAGAPVEGVR